MMTSATAQYPPPPSPQPPTVTNSALTSPGLDVDEPLNHRLAKRPLVGHQQSHVQENAACKKRRKQSTPIRISTSCEEGGVVTPIQTPTPPDDDDDEDKDEQPQVPFLPPSPQNRSPVGGSTPNTIDYSTGNYHQHDNQPLEQLSRIESPVSRSWIPPNEIGPKAAEQADWPVPLQGVAPLYLSHLPAQSAPELVAAAAAAAAAGQPRAQIRIFNPEAYCELCNKEFCNKYFLKTHKANKHRIYTDPPVSDMLVNIPTFSTKPTLPKITNNNNNSNGAPTTNGNELIKPPTYNCDLCGKTFSYKILLKNHKRTVHGIESENDSVEDFEEREPGQLDIPRDLTAPSSEDEPITPTKQTFPPKNGPSPPDFQILKDEPNEDDKMSPQLLSAETSNRLRRMGIMNPEAFCEICCKEYCNKYFLRTHKMKRHGIIIPDDGPMPGKPPDQPSGSGPTWYQIQTSPLNLIMGEQSTNSSGSERRPSPTSADNECENCGLRFQTPYLAQLHQSVNCRGSQITENRSSPENNNEKADAISEDLQKLQTMILQLNNLGNQNEKTDTPRSILNCTVCGKEMENRYHLQSHMMSEHGVYTPGDEEEREDVLVCKLCGRDGFTVDTFRQHMIELHSPTGSTEPNTEPNENTEISKPVRAFNQTAQPERRSSVSLTPTSSYCEICNKELCNKYFMKTHMQRMHGIEIENGAQIGGVVCNICNKELCSKYFLRVHKHNTHGIVEEGSGSQVSGGQTRPMNPDGELSTGGGSSHTNETDNALKPDLADLSHRYFSHFSEVCTICNRRFRSTKWLKAHLLGDHGKVGTDKWNELEVQLQQSFGQQRSGLNSGSPLQLKIPNGGSEKERKETTGVQSVLSSLFGGGSSEENVVKQYFCSYCSFSTPVLAFLFVHERSHGSQMEQSGEIQCGVCNQKFQQPEQLQHHVLSQHPFMPGFGGDDKKKDVGLSLKDVCKQSNLPATYALPQTSSTRYIMQAFLMDEPTEESTSSSDRKFAPSIVFLPVLERVSAPVTVSFTLTPT